VISTPITCTATSGAIVNRGATIVWADVDRQTGNIDPADVEQKITPKTKAIVAVDWGGRICDYVALSWAIDSADIPEHQQIPMIQDAAHSFLADGACCGDYTAYSFGPIKHLTCGGYGGALTTPPEQTKRARLLRWHGLDRRSSADFRCSQDIVEAGYRGHMTDDQAAVGLANAERIEWVVAKHRENAAFYDHVFRSLPGISSPPADSGSSYWLYTLTCDDRDGLMAHLAERGVASSPVHAINTWHTAFRRQSRGADSVPNADWFDAHQVSIPVGWWLTPEDREQVAAAVVSFACRVGAAV
jgi:dTDP-4-amino-4,6-dideoxygalactose transaminase